MLAPILLGSLIIALVHPESIPLRADKNKVLEAQLCKMTQPSPKPHKLCVYIHIYTMLEQMFRLYLKIYLHNVKGHVSNMFEDKF